MAAPTTVEEALEQAALGPKQAMVGRTQATSQDLDQLQRLADREKAEAALAQGNVGLRFFALKPGAGGF